MPTLYGPTRADLTATREAIVRGQTSARAEMEKSIQIADSAACRNTFLHLDAQKALVEAIEATKTTQTAQNSTQPALQPLAGLAISVKDLFDIAGQPTRAGSKVLANTVPITAPAISSLAPASGLNTGQDAALDAEFWRVNALLLRNTSVVNLLDGCAISLPCHAQDELPVDLMLWHGAMHDNTLLQLATCVESALAASA